MLSWLKQQKMTQTVFRLAGVHVRLKQPQDVNSSARAGHSYRDNEHVAGRENAPPTNVKSNKCGVSPISLKGILNVFHSLQASLSGTFLQILPDLVTPLKGHSISAQLSTDAVSAL